MKDGARQDEIVRARKKLGRVEESDRRVVSSIGAVQVRVCPVPIDVGHGQKRFVRRATNVMHGEMNVVRGETSIVRASISIVRDQMLFTPGAIDFAQALMTFPRAGTSAGGGEGSSGRGGESDLEVKTT